MLDCLASILAGSSARPVQIMAQFADTMGPSSGPSENLVTRKTTSPLFAAMVNAAAAHMVEQDDVPNGPVFHPAAVVFPPAKIGGASCRDRGCQYVSTSVGAGSLKKKKKT